MKNPLLYEVNTRCWLREWAEREGRKLTLATIPEAELQGWQEWGFTHIWLMGVWETSSQSRMQAQEDPQLRGLYDEVLPGWREEDVPGSPYAIDEYEVAKSLGGNRALEKLRGRLAKRGMKLILDFVPNHFGLGHRWAKTRPDWFVNGGEGNQGVVPVETPAGPRWLALGKDPNFPPWPDTLQIDYRRPAVRAAMIRILGRIASQCDGVRCDMAMLVLNEVFARTWAHQPLEAEPPTAEFWVEAIAAVREQAPEFVFLAEAYWGLEGRLQELGFDYTYDKHVYDCLMHHQLGELQRHLGEAPASYVARSAHFLENHDEPRVATRLSPAEQWAAALVILGLPGMGFLQEGQLTGARVRVPVQLGRRPREAMAGRIGEMYEELLRVRAGSALANGEGRVLRPEAAWTDNPTAQNFVVTQWQIEPGEFDLVVVNLAAHRSQCRVRLEIAGLAGRQWTLRDRLGTEVYERSGDEMAGAGLFLDLPEHGSQIFQCK